MPTRRLKAGYFYRGRKLRIFYAIRKNGAQPASKFLDELKKNDPQYFAKIITLVRRLGDIGRITNKQQFRCEDDGIFAFKAFQVRLLGFYGPRGTFILTHGLKKKKQKLDQSELEKAKTIRHEFNQLVEDGRIVIPLDD